MYRSNPFCSTKTPGLNMWKHLWTRKRENPKTGGINLWTRKRRKRRKQRKQENRENGENAKTRKRRKPENGENAKTAKTRKPRKRRKRENAKTAKTRKRENGENDENPKTAKSVPVFWFSISRFLVFSVFSVFWFSRFLVFSFRWPHPSGQVAFFMCLDFQGQQKKRMRRQNKMRQIPKIPWGTPSWKNIQSNSKKIPKFRIHG